ncbi:hypothetical protein GP486_001418 [Trichoglossum hirsutum]|uniref:Uncharacterized protein n=1 Tax=Trichoglossum hirsutum TaxID=265104 RepID=A0A9P8LH66_9PEZI|nr:hypothetical protein GP486_001418 [Trichoglossum hirsutum]
MIGDDEDDLALPAADVEVAAAEDDVALEDVVLVVVEVALADGVVVLVALQFPAHGATNFTQLPSTHGSFPQHP